MELAASTPELKRQSPHSQDQALFRAILIDALETIDKGSDPNASKRAKADAREAEQWLLTEDHDWVFSAVNGCEQLSLSYSAIVDGYRKGTLQIMVHRKRMMAESDS